MHPSNLCTLDFRYLNPPLEALSINHKSTFNAKMVLKYKRR